MKIKFRLIFLYILFSVGLWMFMTSYSESYNRLESDKIEPANVTVCGNNVELTLLREEFNISVDSLMPESKLYYFLYMAAPDEMRFIFAVLH
jgi:hypothetical protein